MTEKTHIAEGDTLTFTITGKVVDPSLAGTVKATVLTAHRPGASPVQVEAILASDATISYEVTSRFKNGVHIDAEGQYWMRRPDGWYRMNVSTTAVTSGSGFQFAPRGVHRLREDRDQPE